MIIRHVCQNMIIVRVPWHHRALNWVRKLVGLSPQYPRFQFPKHMREYDD